MTPKKTAIGIVTGALLMGGVDASTLNEQPIERLEMIASEQVLANQAGNTVETTLPWKGENGLTVKYDMGEPTTAEKLKDKRDKEVITEVVNDSNGFKVDIILNEKPATNCFTYQIDGWEDYIFEWQPPLTIEEIKKGAVRPEEIVGSYAVYSKSLRDNNYQTGKMVHIPYPYVWELNNEAGTKERAESFRINDGVMTVCASQKFLDKATYPVRIDPTFGYTSSGASSATFARNAIFGYATSAPASVSLDSISVYTGEGTPANQSWVKAALTLFSDNTIVTNGVGDQQEIVGGGPVLVTSTFSTKPAVTSGTDYILAVVASSSASGNQVKIFFDTTGATASYFNTANNYASPATWASRSGQTRFYSTYATYTTGGGAITSDEIFWFE
jgi:hypothetical protein